METHRLGDTGPLVSMLGLGCMGMSDLYGPADRAEGIATIQAALDSGINLLDTGDFYGMGDNEMLIRDALRGRSREDIVISVKFGALRDLNGNFSGIDTRPVAVRNFLAYTLRRLGTDYVDIYRPARLDPNVPIEETVGAVAELVKAGHVRHVGLSEVGAATLRRAHAVHQICDLQIEYSLVSRGIEAEILPTCKELGIGITAYGVLARGLISGHWSKGRATTPGDFRMRSPRFSTENIDKNLAFVEILRGIAQARGLSVAELAIAWVLSRGSGVVPLVGARRRPQWAEALKALSAHLSAEDLAEVERAARPGALAGERYDPRQMAILDSERGARPRA
ncbi:MAG: aldo/keto reductase [Hyphomicrobiales bacterium]|nr:aldo/keto reductase [Hyphomicrobiales bacterium]